MKLIRVEHIRCGEYDGYTYMLAPDDITQEKLDEDVWKAMENYLNAKAEFKKMKKRPEYFNYNLNNIPENMTVKEAKELSQKRDQEIREWEDAERKCTRSFGFWMRDLGYTFLCDASENDVIESTANWGHRHAEHIKYDVTDTDITLQEKEVRMVPMTVKKSEPLILDKVFRKLGIK